MSLRKKIRKHIRWMARKHGIDGMLSAQVVFQNAKHKPKLYDRHAPYEFQKGWFFDGWFFK